jgi:hypothetical protein
VLKEVREIFNVRSGDGRYRTVLKIEILKRKETNETIRFAAKLIEPKAATGDAWRALTLPKNASRELRGVTKVEGIINGYPFGMALESDGKGSYWLKVNEALRKAAGAEDGEPVTVEITRVGEEAETRTPKELSKALATVPRAEALWAEITPMARRDWILWIITAKQFETRQIRIEKACDMLAATSLLFRRAELADEGSWSRGRKVGGVTEEIKK